MLDRFFFDTAALQPDAPALWVDDALFSYRELAAHARRVTTVLQRLTDCSKERTPCLLLAHRSEQAYAGLLGILAAGHAYVPLGAHFPLERNAAIARRSGARILLVDERSESQLDTLRPLLDPNITIIRLADVYRDAYIDLDLKIDIDASLSPSRLASDTAYILFTSGTTGVPKGVRVTHANAAAYMASQLQLDPAEAGARFSQAFDLTFDLSVHDIFVCWANAGCLYVPASSDPLSLAAFVRVHELTHWGSVPSTAAFIQQFRKLKPGVFPSLRMSMFCGEALPTALALAWAEAAPNSRILNLYGPTEATISCMRYEVFGDSMREFDGGVIPLGWSIPGEETMIVDEDGSPVRDGLKGELLLGGHQIAAGYISDNPRDHAKFFEQYYPGRESRRWYRTGDVASTCATHGMRFHGRLDGQIKIRGNRIELQEVEHAVKLASESPMVAVVAWPCEKTGSPSGLVAFIQGDSVDDTANQNATRDEAILKVCRARLPVYGVPNRIVRIAEFPVNANGKIDRNALFGMCQRSDVRVMQVG